LGPLSELAARRQVCIVLVKHLNKGAGAKAVARVSGSMAWVNACRATYIVAPHPEDDAVKVFDSPKGNLRPTRRGLKFRLAGMELAAAQKALEGHVAHLSPEEQAALAGQLYRVDWLGESDVSAETALGAHGATQGANRIDRCAEWMVGFLGDLAYPSEEVKDAALAARFTFDTYTKAT